MNSFGLAVCVCVCVCGVLIFKEVNPSPTPCGLGPLRLCELVVFKRVGGQNIEIWSMTVIMISLVLSC